MAHNLGPASVLVTPVNAASKPVQPYSLAELTAMFATTSPLSAYWLANSYGRYGPWTGTVLPYQSYPDLAAPIPYDCSARGTLNGYAFTQARAILGTAYFGFWPKVIAQPDLNCGIVGGAASGGDTLSMTGRFGLGVIAHENGHTFGLKHAAGQYWQSGTLAVDPEGDLYSIMGHSVFGLCHYSAIEKRQIGWLDVAGTPRSLLVTASGDYALEPYEHPVTSTGIVALRVNVAGQTPLTIEARVDGDKNGNWPGVILHSGDATAPLLLNTGSVNADRWTLPPGQPYLYNGVTVTTVMFSSVGAVVRVTLPGATPAPQPPSNVRVL